MPHVAFTRHLSRFFPDLAEGEVPGSTVREIIDELERRHPGLASYIVDETGRLRRHVNIFVGDEPVGDREHLADALRPTDRVFILQALSGG
jgi:sulfur carrier protein ThiS